MAAVAWAFLPVECGKHGQECPCYLRPGLTGQNDVQTNPDCQPWRDRLADPAGLPRDGHRDRGRVQRGGPRLGLPGPGQRGLLHRPAQGRGQLPENRSGDQRGRDRQRAGDPSGVRIPGGKRPFCRRLPKLPDRLHRALAGGHGPGGRQERRPQEGPGSGRAHRPRQRGPGERRGPRRGGGPADRLPGVDQGLRRRRRTRDARGGRPSRR